MCLPAAGFGAGVMLHGAVFGVRMWGRLVTSRLPSAALRTTRLLAEPAASRWSAGPKLVVLGAVGTVLVGPDPAQAMYPAGAGNRLAGAQG